MHVVKATKGFKIVMPLNVAHHISKELPVDQKKLAS